MAKAARTRARLFIDMVRQPNLNILPKSDLLDKAGAQIEFPRTLRQLVVVGPCVSLGVPVDVEMVAKLDLFLSRRSQLELAVCVADTVPRVLMPI